MLVVRLKRISKKSHPTYRLVVAEKSAPVEGKFIADVGFYNPHTKKSNVVKEELMKWLNKGAKPSNTVSKILKSLKFEHASIVVINRAKRAKKSKKKTTEKTAPTDVVVKAEVNEKSDIEAEVVAEPHSEEKPSEEEQAK